MHRQQQISHPPETHDWEMAHYLARHTHLFLNLLSTQGWCRTSAFPKDTPDHPVGQCATARGVLLPTWQRWEGAVGNPDVPCISSQIFLGNWGQEQSCWDQGELYYYIQQPTGRTRLPIFYSKLCTAFGMHHWSHVCGSGLLLIFLWCFCSISQVRDSLLTAGC